MSQETRVIGLHLCCW